MKTLIIHSTLSVVLETNIERLSFICSDINHSFHCIRKIIRYTL